MAKKTPSKKSNTTSSKPKTKKPAEKKVLKFVAKKKTAAVKAKPEKMPAKADLKGTAKAKLTLIKATPSALNFEKFMSPLDDRVVIKCEPNEKKTAGGLIIPDSAQNSSGNRQGKIIAVGKGHRNKKGKVKPMDVKIGDHVLFTNYSGTELELQGIKIQILRESEILGILTR